MPKNSDLVVIGGLALALFAGATLDGRWSSQSDGRNGQQIPPRTKFSPKIEVTLAMMASR
jgi:hypothetical protein